MVNINLIWNNVKTRYFILGALVGLPITHCFIYVFVVVLFFNN